MNQKDELNQIYEETQHNVDAQINKFKEYSILMSGESISIIFSNNELSKLLREFFDGA
jgi:hypothetical protein